MCTACIKRTRMSYTLNFENHYSTLISALNKFREAKKFHDVCFLADSEKIYVNRTVLAAYSPYMEQILNDLNNTTVVFVAHGISAKTMNQLIDFMYRGVINIAQEDVLPLINAAKIYQIVGLKDCSNSEGSMGKTTYRGQQFSCTTPLHLRHLHTQTYMDPTLQKVPPSTFTASHLLPRGPPHTVSSQPLEQSPASPPHKCCPHICAATRATISSSTGPSDASLACNMLLASGITITPTAVEPATSSSALFECSPNSCCHQQRIGSPVKSYLASVSDNTRQNYENPVLEPVAVPSSSSPDHVPSQSAPVQVSVTQVTTSCSSAPATTTQSLTGSVSQSFPNRVHSKDSEKCESPPGRSSRERSRSPIETPIHHASPAPSERNVGSVVPKTRSSDVLSELEELASDLQNVDYSSSEGDDDIINKVLAYSDTVLPATSTLHTKSTSSRGTGSKGSVARRGHSIRSPGVQKNLSPLRRSEPSNNESPAEESRTVSACQWSKFENLCVSDMKSAYSESKGNVREQYRGVGRPRGRRRGKSRFFTAGKL